MLTHGFRPCQWPRRRRRSRSRARATGSLGRHCDLCPWRGVPAKVGPERRCVTMADNSAQRDRGGFRAQHQRHVRHCCHTLLTGSLGSKPWCGRAVLVRCDERRDHFHLSAPGSCAAENRFACQLIPVPTIDAPAAARGFALWQAAVRRLAGVCVRVRPAERAVRDRALRHARASENSPGGRRAPPFHVPPPAPPDPLPTRAEVARRRSSRSRWAACGLCLRWARFACDPCSPSTLVGHGLRWWRAWPGLSVRTSGSDRPLELRIESSENLTWGGWWGMHRAQAAPASGRSWPLHQGPISPTRNVQNGNSSHGRQQDPTG